MHLEIEAKFLHSNFDNVRARLQEAGAVLEQPMRLMRRVTIETSEMRQRDAFLRVRDEGHRVTMTHKHYTELSIDGAQEIEVVVSDFDKTIELLAAVGLAHKSFQESKRETWRLGNVEVVLDEWPWLEPFIEIEGVDEHAVRDVAEKLGFDWADAVFGDVMVAYRDQYPHLAMHDTVADIPEAKFGMELPAMLRVAS